MGAYKKVPVLFFNKLNKWFIDTTKNLNIKNKE